MAIRYSCALEIIESVARDMLSKRFECEELVPLEDSVQRIAGKDYTSPDPVPPFNSAAVDGFAVRSSSTIKASADNPVLYHVRASNDPATVPSAAPDGPESCVEIMDGARIPDAPPGKSPFDACMAFEEVEEYKGPRCAWLAEGARYIKITRPVAPRTNVREAGSDLKKGDLVIKAGHAIRSNHVIPLAATGASEFTVTRRMQVAIWSTGREIVAPGSWTRGDVGAGRKRDINGPYLTAVLHEAGAEEEFLGIIDDDEAATLEEAIRGELESPHSDVLITTGAVSSGKSDVVGTVLERLGATIHFHGVAVRPGYPVLFATVACASGGSSAFFGLPGDPTAAAVCFKFLVTPYLRHVQRQALDQPIPATLVARCSTRMDCGGGGGGGSSDDGREGDTRATDRTVCPLRLDHFRHGVMRLTDRGKMVELGTDQSPWRVAPYAEANCWVHLSQGQEIVAGALVPCYPMSAGVESLMCNCLR